MRKSSKSGGEKLSRIKVSLADSGSSLLAEYDYRKNTISASEIGLGAREKVHWRCRIEGCGYEWQASVSDRFYHKRGCPACSHRVTGKNNSLFVRSPLLTKEWHTSLNSETGITPETIMAGSHRIVWWKCSLETCGYEWRTSLDARFRLKNGCPVCANRVITKDNCLAAKSPFLAAEWHQSLNLETGFNPNNIAAGSRKAVSYQSLIECNLFC